MSDYNEHLISMAGGDGDVLGKIEARAAKSRTFWGAKDAVAAFYDRNYLLAEHRKALALVREQAAKLAAVRELHVQKFYDKWGRTSEVPTEHGGWCNICTRFDGANCSTIAALDLKP